MTTINYRTIRWSELRLPNPERPDELVQWKVDGPFALRRFYRVPDSDRIIELDLSHRSEDGTLQACLLCGKGGLSERAEPRWLWISIWAILGLGLAPFTFGISLLLVAYPLWFLWASAPRVESCKECRAEFVDFRHGPRP